jgi:hypothetical protein
MSVSHSPSKIEAPPISGFFPAIELWADEDQRTLEDLRDALLSDLAPGTPYQHALANNLVELEWDKLRHRRMRDALLRAALRQNAVNLLSGEHNIFGPALGGPERETAAELVGPDPVRRKAAEEKLVEAGASLNELLAQAYQTVLPQMDHHERQIAGVEIRRRKLRQDYDLLKSRHVRLVEEAEILRAP